ncbi:NAD(P)(+) transhydrogenase (Re/Si-specific) subunit beta, partial [Actinoplanes sp. KI2]|uniref:NAD(P)(+) transhydrogenase (Re/Si-specific) subunit beta n=1 Tax=Actinoplanes sp. KI2 TaxID=2983315 RepID=UPI0021D60D27
MSGFDTIVHLVYLACAVCFVIGLHQMNAPATARQGNRISAAGMAAAILTTAIVLVHDRTVPAGAVAALVAGAVAGGAAGLIAARR